MTAEIKLIGPELCSGCQALANGDRRRIAAAPRPVVAGDHPMVAGFGSFTSRIEHRCAGLVHEQLG